jgi:type IV pilus assembly protein PilO
MTDQRTNRFFRPWEWGILLAVAVMLYVLAGEVVPRAREAVRLQRERSILAGQLRRAAGWQEELARLNEETTRLRETFSLQYVSLPRRGELSSILHEVSEAARAAGLHLMEIRPESEIMRGTYDDLPIRVRMEGRFHGVGDFVYRVERSPRLIAVRNLDVRSDAADPGHLRASVLLHVTMLRDEP